jgi:hypothetical protein
MKSYQMKMANVIVNLNFFKTTRHQPVCHVLKIVENVKTNPISVFRALK